MSINQTKTTFGLALSIVALSIATFPGSSEAGNEAWKSEMIADALQAAPSAVTDDATIYGWTAEGELILARFGAGPYTCVSSGSFSLRLGKPPLPYPDPMCLDQNAWAFLQALWSTKPVGERKKRLPAAPGLIWMLAGMNVSKSAVDIGASGITVTQEKSEPGESGALQMTPHVMIMPLPFNENAAGLTTSYHLDDPLGSWIMAAGKPHEHLMVHFSAQDVTALMETND